MQRPSRPSSIGVAVAFACLLAAISCGTPLATESNGVDKIVLTPSAASVQAGATVTLTALVLDAVGNAMRERKVVWASENESIATVSQSGVVTGVAGGTVQIAASSGGKSANAAITVTARPVSLVRITPGSATIPVTGSVTLQAEALDASGAPVTGRPVAWTSSNETVAVVGGGGVVAGIAVGSVTITATIDGRAGTAAVTVAPQPVASVSVSPLADTIIVGRRVTFRATPLDARNLPLAGRSIGWTSDDPAVATVSSSGEVVGLAVGAARIRATVEGHFAEGAIVVLAVPVATVTVAPANPTMSVGQTLGMTAIMRDASGNVLTRDVTWASANPSVVTINTNTGVVTAVASGNASVTASVIGDPASGSTTITVSVVQVARVNVAPTTVALNAGQTSQFTATVYDGNTPPNVLVRAIVWHTNNSAVATVSSSGLVTAVGNGSTTISATAGGVTGTAIVTVAHVPVANVTVTPGAPNMFPGDVLPLSATARDAGGNVLTGRPTTWASSNTSIATVVAATGVVTAVATGNATITATVDGVSGSATVAINATPVASVVVTPSTATIPVSATTQLIPAAKDSAGNTLTRTIAWVSLAPNVATVSATGLVTGQTGGSTTIEARAVGAGVGGSDVVGTAAITVGAAAPVQTVTVTAPRGFIVLGDTMHLTVVLRDAQNNVVTGRPITFVSSAPWNATVDAAGVVAGLSTGNAYIVATSEGRFGTVQVNGQNGIAAMSIAGPHNNIAQDTLLPRKDKERYTVTVTDGSGRPIQGHVITISNSNPSAMSISRTSDVTNSSGRADVDVHAANAAGSATITFTASRAGAIPPGAPGSNTPAVSIRIVVP